METTVEYHNHLGDFLDEKKIWWMALVKNEKLTGFIKIRVRKSELFSLGIEFQNWLDKHGLASFKVD